MDLANENSPEADIVGLPKVTDIISELLTGKMDAAYIETDVAKSYQKNLSGADPGYGRTVRC